MADIYYPADLPCPLVGSLAENQTETKVDDRGEVGAPRARNRFTRALQGFSYDLRLTRAQKDALYAFYNVVLERGVKQFIWTHPFSKVQYLVRMPTRPAATHISTIYWAASVTVEEV